MTKIYKDAFAEVEVVLSYLDDESYNKIPKEIIEAIIENKNDEHKFYINESLPLEDQNMLEETRAILFNIYTRYIASDEKKKKIFEFQNARIKELEEEKKLKYNSNDIFKERKSTESNIKENSILVVEKQNLFQKIVSKVKSVLFRNN